MSCGQICLMQADQRSITGIGQQSMISSETVLSKAAQWLWTTGDITINILRLLTAFSPSDLYDSHHANLSTELCGSNHRLSACNLAKKPQTVSTLHDTVSSGSHGFSVNQQRDQGTVLLLHVAASVRMSEY